jgi:hypothetical protein
LPRKPPLLPSEILRRVLRTARLDGTTVLVLSGAFALLAAASHDVNGAGTGVAIAAAGAMELHGAGLLRKFDEKGMRWLIGSQLFLMACIFAYTYFWLNHVSVAEIKASLKGISPDQLDQFREVVKEQNLTPDEALRQLKLLFCGAVAFGTLIYQGGMSIYYSRRRAAVAAALHEGN